MIFIFDYLRGAGTIIGLATGDALGAPLEGLNAQKIPVTDIISGGYNNTRAGDITDDTLLALAIAESLIEMKGFFPDDIALRMCMEYQKEPRFFGPTSKEVFSSILNGMDYSKISYNLYKKGGGKSNGSVMRGPPLGVFYPPGEVRAYSILCSQITHFHPVSCECSALINSMISRLCRGEGKIQAFKNTLLECEEVSVKKILSDYKSYPLNPSLDSLQATHCALSLFLESENFEEMLIRAVNMGGDTDTIGAICGALGGAYGGIDVIPKRWRNKLKNAERIQKTAYILAKNAH